MTLATLTQHPSFWPAMALSASAFIALLSILYAVHVEKKARAAQNARLYRDLHLRQRRHITTPADFHPDPNQ